MRDENQNVSKLTIRTSPIFLESMLIAATIASLSASILEIILKLKLVTTIDL